MKKQNSREFNSKLKFKSLTQLKIEGMIPMIKKYQNEFKGARRPYFEQVFEKRNSDEPRVKQIHKY